MQNTTNYAFRKPDLTDNYAIGDQNANWDSADTQIKSAQTAAAAAVAAGAATDTVIGNRTIDDTVTPSTGPNTTTNLFSMLGKMIKAITGETSWATLPVTSIKALFNSKGAASGIATLDSGGQVPAGQLGNVPAVNAATTTVRGTVKAAAVPAAGDPVALTRLGNAIESLLATTGATNVLSYTPAVAGNFLIYVSARVITAATNITVEVDYTDAGGAQVNMLYPLASVPLGTHMLNFPLFINAVAGSPITVKVTAGTANQAYISSSIVGV
ncbi:MAG: hypothetical protein JWP44_5121 [Mucilaginibacter sp.]|nr:hypothetical protein [Mucilaginibacter sp.]